MKSKRQERDRRREKEVKQKRTLSLSLSDVHWCSYSSGSNAASVLCSSSSRLPSAPLNYSQPAVCNVPASLFPLSPPLRHRSVSLWLSSLLLHYPLCDKEFPNLPAFSIYCQAISTDTIPLAHLQNSCSFLLMSKLKPRVSLCWRVSVLALSIKFLELPIRTIYPNILNTP